MVEDEPFVFVDVDPLVLDDEEEDPLVFVDEEPLILDDPLVDDPLVG